MAVLPPPRALCGDGGDVGDVSEVRHEKEFRSREKRGAPRRRTALAPKVRVQGVERPAI